jgi:MoaA/NifB/PqqE/SkfB family radical SAM enzyme
MHGVPSTEAVLGVAAGCSLRCAFCDRAPDRSGIRPSEILSPDFPLPFARRIVIGFGDVANLPLEPLIERLRAANVEEVLVYAHAGTDASRIASLAAAGLTGVLVQVPAADAEAIARLTRGTATVGKLARFLDAVAAMTLAVEIETPVLPSTHVRLADTVRRTLRRICRPATIHLAFGAEGLSGPPIPWDFRKATADVQSALEAAREFGATVRFASPVPPPCLLNLTVLDASLYPALKADPSRTGAPGPFQACDECVAAGSCAPVVPHFAPSTALGQVQPIRPERGPATTSAELYIRHATLADLRQRIDRGPRPACLSPWSVLAAHNPNGSVTPCRGSLLRDAVYAVTGNWLSQPLLEVWNSDGMRQVRRAHAAGQPHRTCKDHCPVFFGSAHMTDLPSSIPMGRAFSDNLVLQLQEMLDGADVLQSRPTCLVISPSLTCNNHCRMCSVHDDVRPWTEMPPEVWASMEEMLPTLRDLSFAGAEPLTSPRFAELVRRCDTDRYPDLEMTLTTNGLLLEPALLRDMARARFRTVIVSINASSDATYERITGTRGGYLRAMTGVRTLLDACSGWRNRPQVVLSFVVMRSNAHEMAAFVDLAVALGVGFRLLPVERDAGGESIFTDAKVLGSILDRIAQEIRPRVAGIPWAQAEIDLLQARLRFRLNSGDLAPL